MAAVVWYDFKLEFDYVIIDSNDQQIHCIFKVKKNIPLMIGEKKLIMRDK